MLSAHFLAFLISKLIRREIHLLSIEQSRGNSGLHDSMFQTSKDNQVGRAKKLKTAEVSFTRLRGMHS